MWLATGTFALALFQLISAPQLYGKIGSGRPPRWLGRAHPASGTGALLLSIPVA